MYPPPFTYERPASLAEALAALTASGGSGMLLAGGHSLLPRLKLREVRPQVLIDIGRLEELGGGPAVNGAVVLPSLTTHAQVAESVAVGRVLPILTDVASQLGDPQVRNVGTVGGSAAEIYPGGDWAPALIAVGATLVCRSQSGERRLAAEDQFRSDTKVELAADEVVVRIEVVVPAQRSGGAHLRLERRAGLAVASCSVQVTLDDSGRYDSVTAAWGGVRRGPVTAGDLRELLIGERPDAALHDSAAKAAVGTLQSFSDVRGSAAYRTKIAAVLLSRALGAASRRADGEEIEVRDVV